MNLKPFARPVLECNTKALWKLAKNMCWRGYWGMREFERRMKNGGPFFPAFVMISVTDACNYRCKGCWVSNAGKTLGVEQIQKIIDAAKRRGSYFFGLLGGEPLAHKGLLKIIEGNPDCYFQIFTNGSLLDGPFAERLRAAGNATVLISLEGLKEESAKRRGAENAFEDALRAMEHCRKAGLFFGAASSVCKSNMAELVSDGHAEFLASRGAHYLWYYIYRPVGPEPGPDIALDEDDILFLRRRIVGLRQTAPLIIIDAYWDHEGRAICPAASGMSHHVSPAGDLEFCPPIQFAAENAADGDVGALFENSKFLKDFREFAAKRSRGCVLLEDPAALRDFLERQGARPTSGRPDAVGEIAAMSPRAGHDMGENAIPEKGFAYRLLKKKYFFGFGAYG